MWLTNDYIDWYDYDRTKYQIQNILKCYISSRDLNQDRDLFSRDQDIDKFGQDWDVEVSSPSLPKKVEQINDYLFIDTSHIK